MEKVFIKSGDLPISAMSEANRFLYNRVKLVSSKLLLKLDYERLEVGKEYFIVPSPVESDSTVIPAICKGYEITSDFHKYDSKTGIVDTNCNPIFLDLEGNEYRCSHSDIAIIQSSMEDAEEQLGEMKSDLY